MGFFRKKENKIQENTVEAPIETEEQEADDFDLPEIKPAQKESVEEVENTEAVEGAVESESEPEIADETDSESEEDDGEETEGEGLNESDETDTVYDDDPMSDISVETDDNRSEERNSIDIPFSERKPLKTVLGEFYRSHKKAFIVFYAVLATVFVTACGVYIYGCCTIPAYDRIGRNVYIENVNVSGLTYDEALEKVKNTSLLNDKDITVISCGKAFVIDGVEAGLTARVEDTVGKAMRYGKTKNVLLDGFANTLQMFAPKRIVPSADVDEKVIREKLNEFGNIIHGEKIEHQLEVGDKYIICKPGHTGFSGDTDLAYEAVAKAIENEQFSNIRVTLITAPPKDLTIEDLDNFTYTDPQDARFEVADNVVTVVPEVWGRYLDKEEAKTYLPKVYEGGETVNIPYYKSEPAVKEELLNQKLFNGTIAEYSTNYGGSSANRAANIFQTASKINGKVLASGEVFSFNETVGPRSVANGFFEAPEYANGETVMGVGGGTCQVTTTLYNAVLYGDLSVVSKLNHMFPVAYAPLGQDATVSDSGVDFKFMNNMDYPIKLVVTAEGGKLTVAIVGTLRDDTHTVKLEHITKAVGADKSVRSYRYVYNSQGELIRKDDLGKSYYMAH